MRILVIGASRGIGLEFVRQYLAAGEQVTATARSPEALEALARAGAKALSLDLLSLSSTSGLAWRLDGEAFDIAVVSAGVHGPRSPALQVPTEADFDTVMHTNVLGPMRVLPQLAELLAPGARLVVLSSIKGAIGPRTLPGDSLYRASKAALNSVLKDTSLALAGRAVCVSLHPGWVRTDMGGEAADLALADSVSDMRRLIDALTPADNGRFLAHDGSPIDW